MHFLVVMSVMALTALASPDPLWVNEARQLIGVGEVERAGAIKKLKTIPQLPGVLKQALSGPYKFHALDVISVLQIKELVDTLIAVSEKDDLGVVYLSLNTLIAEDTLSRIEQAYRHRVQSRATQAPAKVIMLDTLGRMGSGLPPKWLLKCLDDPSYEVRVSAVYHAGLILKQQVVPGYVDVIKKALHSTPYQVRLQAIGLLKELEKQGSPLPLDLKLICQNERNDKVKSLCGKF